MRRFLVTLFSTTKLTFFIFTQDFQTLWFHQFRFLVLFLHMFMFVVRIGDKFLMRRFMMIHWFRVFYIWQRFNFTFGLSLKILKRFFPTTYSLIFFASIDWHNIKTQTTISTAYFCMIPTINIPQTTSFRFIHFIRFYTRHLHSYQVFIVCILTHWSFTI